MKEYKWVRLHVITGKKRLTILKCLKQRVISCLLRELKDSPAHKNSVKCIVCSSAVRRNKRIKQFYSVLGLTFTVRFGGQGFCPLELASGLSLNRRNHQCATL